MWVCRTYEGRDGVVIPVVQNYVELTIVIVNGFSIMTELESMGTTKPNNREVNQQGGKNGSSAKPVYRERVRRNHTKQTETRGKEHVYFEKESEKGGMQATASRNFVCICTSLDFGLCWICLPVEIEFVCAYLVGGE